MNTKVKVGIAAVIVAALVALIVLDQKTTPKTDASADTATLVQPPAADPTEQATKMRQDDVRLLIDKARQTFVPSGPAPESPKPPAEIKNSQPAEGKQPPAAPRSEEYVIEQGNTLETIAEAKYGSRTFAGLIASANPDVNPNRLRVGKKLVLPPKPEKKSDDAALSPKPTTGGESPVATVGGQRFYTVQPGDTLSAISTRVYNTSRHVDKIWEANRDRIADPSTLYVGAKLVMPDLPVRAAATANSGAAPAPTVAPAGAGKTHAVQQGESLWKIAERYASEKGLTIDEMIQAIVQANPEKLKDQKSLLRLGWQLIVPE